MALESNIHALWGAKQSAKGVAATAPTTATTGKRLILAAQGDLAVNLAQGAEAFNDLDIFGDAQDYIESVIGQGSLPLMGTPTELAWLIWLFNGNETVTPIVGPPAVQEHVSIPGTSQFFLSMWKRVGQTIIERQRFVDCVVNSLEISAGTGQRVMRVTPGIISLDPGEKIVADPTLAIPVEDAFLWTEVTGALRVGGTVMTGPTQYTLTLNKNLDALYADDTVPEDLVPGTPTIGVSIAMILDQPAFDLANTLIYASAAPAGGTKPAKFLGALSSWDVVHTQKDAAGVATGLSAKFELPGLRLEKPSAVAVPNPGGGGGTLELSGQMRKVAGQPAWRSTIRTPNAAVAFTA